MNTLPTSLIIPTRNRVSKLARLLQSLTALKPKPYEIIIVNDGSKDETPALLDFWKCKKSCSLKVVINNKSSKGPASARNQGILAASQKFLTFTDDDVTVDPFWTLMITHRLFNSKPRLCGVGGRVLSLKNDILSQYYEDQKILEPPRQLQYLVTVNCSFKKEYIEEVGLFDESFNLAGGEDTELSLRLKKAKYRFARENKAIVYHDFSSNFLHFCKMWIRYGKGTKKALLKNR